MPRSQRITFGLPPASTYSAESSHSWIDVDMPRLSSTGLPHSATPPEQREVLHVAGADLQDVRVLGHHLDLVRLHDLGHHRQAGLLLASAQQLEAVLLEPLEGVGRGARLEGAAAEHVRAGRLDASPPPPRAGAATRRSTARPSPRSGRRPPATPWTLNGVSVGMGLPARELEGLEDRAPRSPPSRATAARSSCSLARSSPTTPMMVRTSPRERWVLNPSSRTRRETSSMSASLDPGFSTMIMCCSSPPCFSSCRLWCLLLPSSSSSFSAAGAPKWPPHSPRPRTTV